MILKDKTKIFSELQKLVQKEDPEASSHWKFYHKDFAIDEEGNPTGMSGFGGCAPPYSSFDSIRNWILQRKYRKSAFEPKTLHKTLAVAKKILSLQRRAFDLDVLRQCLTLNLLEAFSLQNRTVVVIGDGFASLSSLLLLSGFAEKVFCVNLNKTLYVDLYYFDLWNKHELSFPIYLLTEVQDLQKSSVSMDRGLIGVPASIQRICRDSDAELFVNVASMQEMNPDVIAAYFDTMRHRAKKSDVYFYCCNREEKVLPDGTISRFADYPWLDTDEILVDGLCPWHQEYYTYKWPFYFPYDGPHRHRLVKMSA